MASILDRFVASLGQDEAFSNVHAEGLYRIVNVDALLVCPLNNHQCRLDVLTVGGQVIPSLPPARHEWELMRQDWRCSQCSAMYLYSDNMQAPRCCMCGRCVGCARLRTVCSGEPDRGGAGAGEEGDCASRSYTLTHVAAETDCEWALPAVDIDFTVLFTMLEPANIVTAVNALLTEQQVLVVTKHVEALTSVTAALVALIYPLEWPHIYIPVLPQVRSCACGIPGSPT